MEGDISLGKCKLLVYNVPEATIVQTRCTLTIYR